LGRDVLGLREIFEIDFNAAHTPRAREKFLHDRERALDLKGLDIVQPVYEHDDFLSTRGLQSFGCKSRYVASEARSRRDVIERRMKRPAEIGLPMGRLVSRCGSIIFVREKE
jgi:hypothetical protein